MHTQRFPTTTAKNARNEKYRRDKSRREDDDVDDGVLRNKQLLGFIIELTEDDDDYDNDHEDLSLSPYDIADYLSSK